MIHRVGSRRLFHALIAGAGAALCACAFSPLSQTAAPGATIVVPLIGERAIVLDTPTESADASAFQSSYYPSDPQRGSLFAMVCPAGESSTLLACQGNPHKVDVPIRYVTRVYPDPASQAGIENLVDSYPSVMSSVPMTGQTLLFVDIPTTLSSNFDSCGGCTSLDFDFYVGRHRPFGGGDETSILNDGFGRRLTVVKGTGVPTSQQPLFFGSQFPNWNRLVPYPKCVLVADGTAKDKVAAADLTITVPSTVTVKDVIEEEHLGRHTMVQWTSLSATSISVHLVAPDKKVNRLAVVFQLNGGASSAPTAAAFPVTAQTLYDDLGVVIGGGFAPQVIR